METHACSPVQETVIPETGSMARQYVHDATGAQILSVENEDENKVFGITFMTPPRDSTGVAHIMEHSVLAGSERFPLKEPFVELIKGSLNTFLNAMTYPDRTCYPVASQNARDLQNLMDVYVDAVLHPLLPQRILDQEGWHFEALDSKGPLAYKGVVYNEMKGVFSNPDSLLAARSRQAIFPDTCYVHDSGGDPREIPRLTSEAFLRFHQDHYHPSNARVYFYGDDEPSRRLELVSQWFSGYDRRPMPLPAALQPAWSEPRRVSHRYPAGEQADRNRPMMTINWLLDEVRDPVRVLALSVLSHVLVGTPASPLRRALIESGLGEGLTGGGLGDELRQMYFSVGMKGIVDDGEGKVESLIWSTLRELADHGMDRDTVEASFNSIEFALRENNTGSYPRGLILMLRALPLWLYTGDPCAGLAVEEPLAQVRKSWQTRERYFESLLQGCLLENPHHALVTMEPDAGLHGEEEQREREELDRVAAELDQEARAGLVARTAALEQYQQTPESPETLALIPCLGLEDLDPEIRTVPVSLEEAGPVEVLVHEISTNGIVYVELGFDLHPVLERDLGYLRLYARALTEMGTETQDYVRVIQRIGRDTGGVGAGTAAWPRVRGGADARLYLRGKCVPAKLDAMLDLFRDVLTGVDLGNRERFRQMLMESQARLQSSLVPAGHSFVATRLGAGVDEAGWLAEKTEGLDYYFFIRDLAASFDTRWPEVEASLREIHRRVVRAGGAVCNVTTDAKTWKHIRPRVHGYLAGLPGVDVPPQVWDIATPLTHEAFSVPSQVNFVGQGSNLFAGGYELHGSIFAALTYLRTTWIWERVRVHGGAYGGMVRFDPVSGSFSYLSYRDPNLADTLGVYNGSAAFLRETRVPPEELVRTVIGAIGNMDSPLLPDAQGFVSLRRHLIGLDDARRQMLREQLLGAAGESFADLADALDAMPAPRIVVIGSAESIKEARPDLPSDLETRKLV